MFKSDLPLWFKAWWVLNIFIAIAFLAYWIPVGFESSNIVYGFIIYGNLWGLWAAWYRRRKR